MNRAIAAICGETLLRFACACCQISNPIQTATLSRLTIPPKRTTTVTPTSWPELESHGREAGGRGWIRNVPPGSAVKPHALVTLPLALALVVVAIRVAGSVP